MDQSQKAKQDKEEQKSMKDRCSECWHAFRYKLIRPNDDFKVKWDIIIMTFALFNSFFVPLQVSYSPKQLESPEFVMTNYIVDLFFFGDMILAFRTCYIDEHGAEVTDTKKIA